MSTGSRVLHQVPAGAITPSASPSALPVPLFQFSSVTQYLIPTQQFCDRLITCCVNHHRIIGYPVCVKEEKKYERNEFIFNFAVVISENEADWACYGQVVRKLGRLLRGLEEQGGFLSKEEDGVWDDESVGLGIGGGGIDDSIGGSGFGVGSGSKVYALCEMVLEDLNNYAECMIPIGNCSSTLAAQTFADWIRRLEHDQPEALPHKTTPSTCFRAPSPASHDVACWSTVTDLLRPYIEPRSTVHQRREFDIANCPARGHRPLLDAESGTALSVLRVPGAP
jgi:hypothetical protein